MPGKITNSEHMHTHTHTHIYINKTDLYRRTRAGEPELEFFERAGALFSDVSGAGAGAIKIFGSSYPIIEKM